MRNRITKYLSIAVSVAICATERLSAQEFYLVGAAGASSFGIRTNAVSWLPGVSGGAGAGYHVYLTDRLFLSAGSELSYMSGYLRAPSLSDSYYTTDSEGENFIFRYRLNRVRERQQVWMLHVPLTVNYLFGADKQWYAAVGGRIGVPFGGRYSASARSMDAVGDYSASHGDPNIDGPLFAGFGHFDRLRGHGALSLSTSLETTLELGLRRPLSHGWTLLAGIYLEWGLNNIRTGGSDGRLVDYTVVHPSVYSQNSLLASSDGAGRPYSNTVSTLGAGLRVKFLFGKHVDKSPVVYETLLMANIPDIADDTLPDAAPDKAIAMVPSPQAPQQPFASNEAVDTPPAGLSTQEALSGLAATTGARVDLHRTNFAFGTAILTPLARGELRYLAEWLNAHPDVHIDMIGHTDSVGTDDFNLRLSEERAGAVYSYLKQLGIEAQRLSYSGKGKSCPLQPNDTAEGRAMNRRVEIVVR